MKGSELRAIISCMNFPPKTFKGIFHIDDLPSTLKLNEIAILFRDVTESSGHW